MLGVPGHKPELETWEGKLDRLPSSPNLRVTGKALRVPVHLLVVDCMFYNWEQYMGGEKPSQYADLLLLPAL